MQLEMRRAKDLVYGDSLKINHQRFVAAFRHAIEQV